MTYEKQVWVDEIFDPLTNETIIEGTPFTAKRINHIEDGIKDLDISQEDQDRKIARLELKIALLDRSSSNNVFYDTLDGKAPSKITLDTTNADLTAAATVGTTILSVDKTTGFVIGTEVTIFDDVNQENVMITAITPATNKVTVSAITKAYKKGAKIARSNVVIDAVNQKMKIGDWGTYTIAVSEVV